MNRLATESWHIRFYEEPIEQKAIGDNSRREFLQQEKCQQAIAGNSRRAMLHRAEGESYAPAGAFNQKHSIDQQVDSIGDNSRREFLQQEIDASRRRDMLQQEHLKCQQARAIDQVVNSIVSNAHDSSTAMLSIE
ncbi:hypothetical protein COX84_06960 [Candidatus Micrarchaeota archaeon CG_4_10_14_0_2_um_filter_49_7]|nr:MAG: hypothetical protein AUJ13_06085 [Candidatus Micrarchaeota archaeon CG1_02_49_24]PIZ92345.1 MAG: hypothetical protein COX84_06960 [Candidatus Micrarchaeota archaeon CG_4_10_14_0_2_um_filter_49_7]